MLEETTPPPPPNLIRALRDGFDAIANQPGLILFPVLLDLFLWFGPRLNINPVIQSFLGLLESIPDAQSPQNLDLLEINRTYWNEFAQSFNLLTSLRSYPVGVSSMVSGWQPAQNPLHLISSVFEVATPLNLLLIWVGLTLLGSIFGSLYFESAAQAALHGQIHWAQMLRDLPRTFGQVFLLTFIIGIYVFAILAPMTLVIAAATLMGGFVGQVVVFIAVSVIIWWFLPLLFAPHGIFTYRQPAFTSIVHGTRLTRFAFPITSTFWLIVFILNQGLNLLWMKPLATSWFGLLGIIGHAFTTTALLAASFIYYNDTSRWVESTLQKIRQPASPTA
ncbi:MAG: hypothetical protein OHK0052_04700 [Anaerolineales bacterium]